MEKQVNKDHYDFLKYMNKNRWVSIWHQIHEVLSLSPENILEIGSGPGVFKILISHLGLSIRNVDIDPDLKPDFVASACELPLQDNSFDCVCAFQMLEHLPYEQSMRAFKEMVRVSKKYIVISLPDVRALWLYSFYLPKIGQIEFFIPRPRFRAPEHHFDGEHYWEIGKKGYSNEKVLFDLIQNQVKLLKNFRVRENTYHNFFVFEKKRQKTEK